MIIIIHIIYIVDIIINIKTVTTTTVTTCCFVYLVSFNYSRFIKGGVQWKHGVVVFMML